MRSVEDSPIAKISDRDLYIQTGAEPGCHIAGRSLIQCYCPRAAIRQSGCLIRIETAHTFRDVIRRDDTAIGVTECQVREMPDSLKVYQ